MGKIRKVKMLLSVLLFTFCVMGVASVNSHTNESITVNNTSYNNIEVKIVKAGCWSFLLILNKENGTLYSLMNSKRYNTICSKPQKNAPLYIRALKELNRNLGFANNPLFDFLYDGSEFIERLQSMCSLFSSSVNFSEIHYKILTFTTYESNVVDMELKTLDANLNELYSEKLFDYITKML